MYCSNCGKQIPDDARYCPECGNKVVADESFNQPYHDFENNFERTNWQSNNTFQWKTSAIVWFAIIVLGCIVTIYTYSQLFNYPYIRYIGFNPIIIIAFEILAAASIIILVSKRIKACIYAFYVLKLVEVVYILMRLGSFLNSAYILGLFIGLALNILITYLVLRNYWDQLN
ncbi:zinc ribbon domain-containing protein [uncultured Thomasclavelia sp.]|uniref:zinc ribbon domain-containing protein n=1 Tax=uncultured Thomasclavelia sp. TaxID=3025759 RepID=UPI0025FCFDCA|nr:zinc ribbon domain-containing protein [uncultured Thomasclavelia sp.]